MGILTGSWHLNRSTPIIVEVAKIVSEFLQHVLTQVRIIVRDKEMGGQNASLGCLLADQEKVILVFICPIVNHLRVHYCSSWRVLNSLGQLEEPLVDSFIHNNQSYFWLRYREFLFGNSFQ